MVADISLNHLRHGVWVPAFAGTTTKYVSAFAGRPRLPGTMTRMGRCIPDARRKQPLAPWRIPMELILIILVVMLLFGGGGYWGRRRGHW